MADPFLSQKPVRVFKSDERSRVWQVGTGRDARVLKAYGDTSLGGKLKALTGLHPAQVEVKRAKQMRGAGLAVVPIEAAGTLQGRRVLASPLMGASLQALQADPAGDNWPDDAARRFALDAVVELVNEMFRAGFVNRDLKTSNLVVGPDDFRHVLMIDVAGARRSTDTAARRRTVDMLVRTMTTDGYPDREVVSVERRIAVEPGQLLISEKTGRD